MKIDLSIIVPCYNLENYIELLLVSLKQQEIKQEYNVELIFVLDSCTDKTKDIILKWYPEFKQYTNINLITTNIHKVGLVREEGRKYATGEYIWFIDGDDHLLHNTAINVVLANCKRLNMPTLMHIGHYSYSLDYKAEPRDFKTTVWSYVFNSNFISDLHFNDQTAGEDDTFMKATFTKLEQANKTDQYYILPVPLYFYNTERKNSLMYQDRLKHGVIKEGEI